MRGVWCLVSGVGCLVPGVPAPPVLFSVPNPREAIKEDYKIVIQELEEFYTQKCIDAGKGAQEERRNAAQY
eukprot:650732-Lingulodinium_polyedra.AAC.1